MALNLSPLWAILAVVGKAIFGVLTPEIKKALQGFVKDLYQKALDTDNPADDLFVGLLAELLSVDVSGMAPKASGAVTSNFLESIPTARTDK